jgi:hypothetical protein
MVRTVDDLVPHFCAELDAVSLVDGSLPPFLDELPRTTVDKILVSVLVLTECEDLDLTRLEQLSNLDSSLLTRKELLTCTWVDLLRVAVEANDNLFKRVKVFVVALAVVKGGRAAVNADVRELIAVKLERCECVVLPLDDRDSLSRAGWKRVLTEQVESLCFTFVVEPLAASSDLVADVLAFLEDRISRFDVRLSVLVYINAKSLNSFPTNTPNRKTVKNISKRSKRFGGL